LLRFLKSDVASADQEIPTQYLWPEGANMGLMVTLGNSPAIRVDQFVGSTAIRPDPGYFQPGSLPYTLAQQLFHPLDLTPQNGNGEAWGRWAGEVYTEGGNYGMELDIDASAQLIIDGVPIINNCTPYPGGIPLNGAATLTPGWHRVELRVHTRGPGGGLAPRGLEWIWIKPSGVREVVPPYLLRYSQVATPDTGPVWPPPAEPITCTP